MHWLLFIAALGVIGVEVASGFASGVGLAGAITLFLLGVLWWVGLLTTVNNLMIVGTPLFVLTALGIAKAFKSTRSDYKADKDVNDY